MVNRLKVHPKPGRSSAMMRQPARAASGAMTRRQENVPPPKPWMSTTARSVPAPPPYNTGFRVCEPSEAWFTCAHTARR